jgi:hypothetical protein
MDFPQNPMGFSAHQTFAGDVWGWIEAKEPEASVFSDSECYLEC